MRHGRDLGALAALYVQNARIIDRLGESVGEIKLLIRYENCLISTHFAWKKSKLPKHFGRRIGPNGEGFMVAGERIELSTLGL